MGGESPLTALHAVERLSPADQAREVLAALSIHKTQLAKILGVSRPTLYDWLHGKEPKVANAQRLTTLVRLLTSAGVTSAQPVRPRFVRQPLIEGAPSLLEALSAEPIDERLVAVLAQEAKSLGVLMPRTKERVGVDEAEPRECVEVDPGRGSQDGAWDAVHRAAASVAEAAVWRQHLACALHRATRARFVIVVTCSPQDPFSARAFVEPRAFAQLGDEIQMRYLARIEQGADAMAKQVCGRVYAPLFDAKNAALAEQLRRELLSPAGIEGMLNVFLGDPREGVLGWIALGFAIPCEEALRAYRVPLRESALYASRTLVGAVALGRGCGLIAQAPPPPLTARERQIASLIMNGFSDANIAAQLRLSEETVGAHLRRIYRKLGVHSRIEMTTRLRS